jgi:3-phosphoshikimate 1-carboxyvinyltransferase
MKKNTTVKVFPTSFEGNVTIPASKSMSHRALISAALANGTSTLRNFVYSQDTEATIGALEALGAKFDREKDTIIVHGVKRLRAKKSTIDCNESGSTLRFIIPIVSLLNKEITLTGKESLIKRPQTIYDDIFKKDNNTFEISGKKILVNGSIKARDYYIDGSVSSQFFTGLMFALPLLEGDSTIIIKGHLESKSYIDLTIQVLELYGINIQEIENGYFIKGNQTYKPFDYTIEGDYSQAAYFLVAGVLNGTVSSQGLTLESKQGDLAIVDVIKDMKGKIIFTENGYNTVKSDTKATTVDLQNCPDLGPVITLLASVSSGTTRLINAHRLRIKESDRIESTVASLSALGANIKVEGDTIVVKGVPKLSGKNQTLDSYNDHRIAMMLSIASSVSDTPFTITRADAVNKSYPHFYKDFKQIGGKFEIKD